jgi:penicillin-binding protein 1A
VNQGKNQPGSTFKPIVFATAIENGYEPCSQVKDAPYTFRTNQNPPLWSPRNATSRFNGTTMTLRQAMGRSINRITAFLMDKLGPENVVEMARRLGIESKLDPVLSLSLGTSDVSVLEITGAYSAFANQGTWMEPHSILRIEDRFGNILFKKTPERKEALSDQNAFLMLYMLRGTVEEPGGTANGIEWSLRENNEIGAKTGTTSDYADGWFMGVTQDLVTGIWVGGDDRTIRFRSFEYGQGSRMAMPIWEDFMSRVYNDTTLQIEKKPFARPSGPITVNLNCNNNTDQSDEEDVEKNEKEEVFDVDVF